MKVKSESEVTQSCPTLCDPMDCSLLRSSVHGIFQATVLEWGAIAFLETKPPLRQSVWCSYRGFPGGAVVKKPPANAGDAKDAGSIPGSGQSPGGGNGHVLQYSFLRNPMDRGAGRDTVPGVSKSQAQLSG